jgi:hypothetical protein
MRNYWKESKPSDYLERRYHGREAMIYLAIGLIYFIKSLIEKNTKEIYASYEGSLIIMTIAGFYVYTWIVKRISGYTRKQVVITSVTKDDE